MKSKKSMGFAVLVCLSVLCLAVITSACGSSPAEGLEIKAVVLDKDGNVIEEPDVVVNTQLLKQYESGGGLYETSFTVTSNADSSLVYGVSLIQKITWSDNFGPDNALVEVCGTWHGDSDRISHMGVDYGAADKKGKIIDSFTNSPADSSFSYSPTGVTGYGFYLNTYAEISGYDAPITLYVKTSVVD